MIPNYSLHNTLTPAMNISPTSTQPNLYSGWTIPIIPSDITSDLKINIRGWTIPIIPSDISDLRINIRSRRINILVTVSAQAKDLLLQAPPAFKTLLSTLWNWASNKPQVKSAQVKVISEPEDVTWTELVIELQLDADDELALSLWADMNARIDEAKVSLDFEDRYWFDQHFAIHLIWE